MTNLSIYIMMLCFVFYLGLSIAIIAFPEEYRHFGKVAYEVVGRPWEYAQQDSDSDVVLPLQYTDDAPLCLVCEL